MLKKDLIRNSELKLYQCTSKTLDDQNLAAYLSLDITLSIQCRKLSSATPSKPNERPLTIEPRTFINRDERMFPLALGAYWDLNSAQESNGTRAFDPSLKMLEIRQFPVHLQHKSGSSCYPLPLQAENGILMLIMDRGCTVFTFHF